MTSFATLRSLVRESLPVERCEMCRVVLPRRHRHLIELSSRRLVCACDPCSLLFPDRGENRYRAVPCVARRLSDVEITDSQWESLFVPIGLAFFFQTAGDGRMHAFYPSPAGPTESLLPLDAWQDIAAGSPTVAAMEPDVQALLVNRLNRPGDYYLVGIDKCYELAGLIRANWQGLSGGPAVWDRIREYFAELKDGASA